jgi:hypothetical protein
MTRKHFRALANALHQAKPGGAENSSEYWQWEQCRNAVSRACKDANSRFDYGTFYAACANGVGNKRADDIF